MKYKLIEKVPIPIPRHKNKKDIGEKIIVKAQTEKEFLILGSVPVQQIYQPLCIKRGNRGACRQI